MLGIILRKSKWPISSLLEEALLVRNKMLKWLCQLHLSFAAESESELMGGCELKGRGENLTL